MTKGWIAALALGIGCLLSPAAAADEAVRFADGRYLEIAHHRVDGAWIELHLPGAVLLVPARRVDRIERDGRVLYARPGLVESERLWREKMVLERWGRPAVTLTSRR